MGWRIGLLEDHPDLVTLFQAVFHEQGDTVCAYRDGASFLEALFPPGYPPRVECAFLDLGLPGGMSGLDVIVAIRQGHALDLPIVVTTGFGEAEIARVKASFPDIPVLRKPFHLKDILHLTAALKARCDILEHDRCDKRDASSRSRPGGTDVRGAADVPEN